ncbi:MAG: hypothetical protein DCF22_17750 [Leptolyngbya sp.]|nr:MAG: hypothetical protein DCF22_17750 [Leptolyngbya sp.]
MADDVFEVFMAISKTEGNLLDSVQSQSRIWASSFLRTRDCRNLYIFTDRAYEENHGLVRLAIAAATPS